jgi:hypothetical protein
LLNSRPCRLITWADLLPLSGAGLGRATGVAPETGSRHCEVFRRHAAAERFSSSEMDCRTGLRLHCNIHLRAITAIARGEHLPNMALTVPRMQRRRPAAALLHEDSCCSVTFAAPHQAELLFDQLDGADQQRDEPENRRVGILLQRRMHRQAERTSARGAFAAPPKPARA